MDSRNTKTWLAGGGILAGAFVAMGGQLTALVQLDQVLRLLDAGDLWPF